jgi:hypothetical protein
MEVEVPVEPPTRDADYYFDDGDLIILAENTLFRVTIHFSPLHSDSDFCPFSQVHKFLLSRDSSMFKDMFIIPGGSSTAERTDGSSDETPLRVSDTFEAFRALLWVLYALSDFSPLHSDRPTKLSITAHPICRPTSRMTRPPLT